MFFIGFGEHSDFGDGNSFGAVSEARTRDLRLGKPLLYQLSYYRNCYMENDNVMLSFFLFMEPITRLDLRSLMRLCRITLTWGASEILGICEIIWSR